MKKIKSIVFDFDGVIKESVDIKTKAFSDLYSQYGKRILNKVLNHHLQNGGVSRYNKIKFYHKNFLKIKLSDIELHKLTNQFSEIVLYKVIEAPFVNGAKSFIKNNCKKYTMFISTGTPTHEIHQIIKKNKIDHYFTAVFGSPESKIDHLNQIINKWKINKEEMVFIGDSITDRNASNHYGIKFIAVNNKSDGELINEKNRISDLSELKKMINSIDDNNETN
jgi:phosphoglycolate phosphatase-like HAD superfamily hydrolase